MSPSPPPYDGGPILASRYKRRCASRRITYRLDQDRVRACMACLTAHRKCSGVPCDRCFRLSLRCRPSSMQGAAADGNPPQPLIELLVKRHDGRDMASLYMQAFTQAHREGLIDRDVAIQLLRVWRARSILADADVTFGLAGCISKKLGVLPVEVEGQRDLAWEPPDRVRRMRLVEEAQRAAAAGLEMKKSDLFQRLDDGVTPMCLSVVSLAGRFTMAANGRFEALFRTTSDMLADTDVRKSINCFTAAAIVAPEDRDTLFFNMIRLFSCRSRKRRVTFFKMLDRVEEHPRLVLFTGWQESLPDGSLVVVQRLEPAPRSRHISDIPRAMCVVKKFRAIRQIDEVLEEASQAVAGGAAGGAAEAAEGEVTEAVDGCMLIEPKTGQKEGGKEMNAGDKGAADTFSGMSASFLWPQQTRKGQKMGWEEAFHLCCRRQRISSSLWT